jgi:hypothetical protein
MELTGQWADSLLALERLHVLKLTLWGALSVLVGTSLSAVVLAKRVESALLQHFGIQMGAWGLVILVMALWARSRLALRDLAGAVSLDRFAWLNIGLDAGYVLVGITLALCGWRLGRRPGLVGAGVGVVVQGLALAVLDLQLSTGIVR